jgi:hypothetical protein
MLLYAIEHKLAEIELGRGPQYGIQVVTLEPLRVGKSIE